MNSKAAFGLVPLLLAIMISVNVMPVSAVPPTFGSNIFQGGPHLDNIVIDISLDPTVEFQKLQAGTVDVMDWPLTEAQIRDVLGLDGSAVDSNIALQAFVETGMFVMDINNRCGPAGNPHRFTNASGTFCDNGRGVTDLVPSTSTLGTQVAPISPWTEVVSFRQAIAYLFDRAGVEVAVTQASRIVAPQPPSYKNTELEYSDSFPVGANTFSKYAFNPATASGILSGLGLTDTDGDGILNDPVFNSGLNMVPLIFYIRVDDPRRTAAANIWSDAMNGAGIPVDRRIIERRLISPEVFRQQEYNIYTGGWIFLRDPDYMWDLYGPDGILPGDAFSLNYVHNANDAYWTAAANIKFAPKEPGKATPQIALDGFRSTNSLHTDLVVNLPAYGNLATAAYRKPFWIGTNQQAPAGTRGIINSNADGINNFWSWLNAYRTDVATAPYGGSMRWGFKSNLQDPNPITSGWLWDAYLLSLLFDTSLARDPYKNPIFRPWMSRLPVEATYSGSTPSGLAACPLTACSKLTVDIQPGITFHSYPSGLRLPGPDGTMGTLDDVTLSASGGRAVDGFDLKQSIEYARDTFGFAFGFVANVNEVRVSGIGNRRVEVFFDIQSWLVRNWIGSLSVVPKEIWTTTNIPDPYAFFALDPNGDGSVADHVLVGTGPYILPRVGQAVDFINVGISLPANRGYFANTRAPVNLDIDGKLDTFLGTNRFTGVTSSDVLILSSAFAQGASGTNVNIDVDYNRVFNLDDIVLAATYFQFGQVTTADGVTYRRTSTTNDWQPLGSG